MNLYYKSSMISRIPECLGGSVGVCVHTRCIGHHLFPSGLHLASSN